jgi:hypothetical protein
MFLAKKFTSGKAWWAAGPFLLVGVVIISFVLYPITGFGPANNLYALAMLIATFLSVVLGAISLFLLSEINIWLRLLIALLYLPTTLLILLSSGF